MATMNMIQAVNDALRLEMRRDPSVVVLGEDVGKFGGVFRASQGLQEEFGEDRVIDTPLAESGVIGTAVGMALYGLRPVPEIQFADFIFPGHRPDRERGRQVPLPVGRPVRLPDGDPHARTAAASGAATTTPSRPRPTSSTPPGSRSSCPSNPVDAKGLLTSAIRDPDPVLFFEPKRIYRAAKGEVPDGDVPGPDRQGQGHARGAARHGDRLGRHVARGRPGREEAAAMGIEAEVVDLRSLQPLDIDAIAESVRKTGRAVVVHEAPRTCGFGAELVGADPGALLPAASRRPSPASPASTRRSRTRSRTNTCRARPAS